MCIATILLAGSLFSSAQANPRLDDSRVVPFVDDFIDRFKQQFIKDFSDRIREHEKCCGPYDTAPSRTVEEILKTLPQPIGVTVNVTTVHDDIAETLETTGDTFVTHAKAIVDRSANSHNGSLYGVPVGNNALLATNEMTAILTGLPLRGRYKVYLNAQEKVSVSGSCWDQDKGQYVRKSGDAYRRIPGLKGSHAAALGVSVDGTPMAIDEATQTFSVGNIGTLQLVTRYQKGRAEGHYCNPPVRVLREEAFETQNVTGVGALDIGLANVDEAEIGGSSLRRTTTAINVLAAPGVTRFYRGRQAPVPVALVNGGETSRVIQVQRGKLAYATLKAGSVLVGQDGRFSKTGDKAEQTVFEMSVAGARNSLKRRYTINAFVPEGLSVTRPAESGAQDADAGGQFFNGPFKVGETYQASLTLAAPQGARPPYSVEFHALGGASYSIVPASGAVSFEQSAGGVWVARTTFTIKDVRGLGENFSLEGNANLTASLKTGNGETVWSTHKILPLDGQSLKQVVMTGLLVSERRGALRPAKSEYDLFAGARKPAQELKFEPEFAIEGKPVTKVAFETLDHYIRQSWKRRALENTVKGLRLRRDFEVVARSGTGSVTSAIGFTADGRKIPGVGLSLEEQYTLRVTHNRPILTLTRNRKGAPLINMVVLGPANMGKYKLRWNFGGGKKAQTAFSKKGVLWTSSVRPNGGGKVDASIVDKAGRVVAEYTLNNFGRRNPFATATLSFNPATTMRLGSRELLAARVYNLSNFDIDQLRCRWFFPNVYGKLAGTPDGPHSVTTKLVGTGRGNEANCVTSLDIFDDLANKDSLAELSVSVIVRYRGGS